MAKSKKKDPTKVTKKHSKSAFYAVSDTGVERKNTFCPKCGEGVYLAEHKNRKSCGKCGYMQAIAKAQG